MTSEPPPSPKNKCGRVRNEHLRPHQTLEIRTCSYLIHSRTEKQAFLWLKESVKWINCIDQLYTLQGQLDHFSHPDVVNHQNFRVWKGGPIPLVIQNPCGLPIVTVTIPGCHWVSCLAYWFISLCNAIFVMTIFSLYKYVSSTVTVRSIWSLLCSVKTTVNNFQTIRESLVQKQKQQQRLAEMARMKQELQIELKRHNIQLETIR